MKAADTAKVVKKRAEEKTSKIKADQEAKITEIMKLKTLLEKSKAEAGAEKKRVEVEGSAKDRIKAATMKAVEAFRALEELREEKLQFYSNAYDTRKQFIRDQIAARYLELDLNFLDEDDPKTEEASAIAVVDTFTPRPSATKIDFSFSLL